MGLGELLRRGLFKTFYGGIFHRPRAASKRRIVLVFGDIIIGYMKECEASGFRSEMRAIGEEWMIMYFNLMVPSSLKRLPLVFLNKIMRKAWVSTGLMEDFSIEKKGSTATVRTKNEVISKAIGESGFSEGVYMGIISSLYGKAELVKFIQDGEYSIYEFSIDGDELSMESRTRSEYDRLNRMGGSKGMTLEQALRKRILELKGNRIEFRGTQLFPAENTLFHIIGNRGVLLEKVVGISYAFFRKHVISRTSREKKLLFLRTLLESLGWGIIRIAIRNGRIEFDIRNPPFGIQKGKDNWDFLINMVLGYLWMIDTGYSIKDKCFAGKHLRVTYTKRSRGNSGAA